MFDPIAPATLIGRNTPPAIAFGTSAEDNDRFDDVLRETAADEPAAPARERRRAEPRDIARDTATERSKPATEAAVEKQPAATAAETTAEPTEAPVAKAPTAPAAETETTAGQTAPAANDAAAQAAATVSATPAAALALAAMQIDPVMLTQGRTSPAPAAAASAGELPTLQQLLSNAGFAGTGGGETDAGTLPGERRLPQALAQLLQPAGSSTAAGNRGAAGQGSFQAALAGTALSTTLKPDTAPAATGAAAALPAAAAAPVNPAAAMAPLPAMEPMTPPLAGTGFASSDGGGELKQIATLGATPSRAAVPTTTPSLQIAMHIAKAAQDGMSKVSVRLDPPELGRVDVKLEVGHDGRVQAVVSAERQETLDMLQRDARDLARALKDAGLQADTGNLNFSLRQNGGDGPATNDGRGRPPGDDLLADEPLVGGVAGLDDATARPTVAGNHALDISV